MNILNFLISNSVFLLGTFTAIKGVFEYSQKRKFEKNLFLHEQMNKFFEIEEVQVVHRLLDWNSSRISYSGKEYFFDDGILLGGIQTHDKKTRFDEREVIIRKVFDKYFDELNHLVILKDCNLLDESNLRKFLKYWIEIIKGEKRNKSSEIIKALHKYLEFYDYIEVKKFILK